MKILCYGDSNTWGHDPIGKGRFDETIRWTKLLQKQLGSSHEIIEEGLCGRCASFIDSVKPYRHGLSSLRMVIETHQPIDLVIIMLGTNDLKSCFCADAVSITNGIKEMILTIQNKNIYNIRMSIPKILIVSPIHLKDNFSDNERTVEQFNQKGIETSKKLAHFYEIVANENNCEFLDASQYAEASDEDSIHMNQENHQKLAQVIYEKIKKVVE